MRAALPVVPVRPAALAPSLLACLLAFSPPGGARAEEAAAAAPPIRVEKVAGSVHALFGDGGNVGVSVGADGAFLVDDKFAPLTDAIVAAVATLTDGPVRFVVNTHWHGDHTGGNENFGKAGAILVAHENVRRRLSTDQLMAFFDRKVPASPAAALPVITFADALSFHWNGEEIRAFHVSRAHTDGDTVLHFTGSDVVHAGDTFFNGNYPFIDVGSGGGIDGVIAAADRILSVAGPSTRIIPGHGPIAGAEDLRRYRDMLATARGRVAALLEQGRTRDEIVASKPTADLDAAWGEGWIKPDQFVGFVVESLAD